jgi:anaerobic selenocysteine-containing dehydrogenase
MTKNLWETLLLKNDQFVEVHPETARSLRLREGDGAKLKTPHGEVSVRVHLSKGAPPPHGENPGYIFVAQGLGHTAYDEYIQGKGVNANDLVEVHVDSVTGIGMVWTTRAQLLRA